MEKKYYLGLDMGTDSVGWAVTDEHYNLMRAKGKDLWGVREFEEAHAAAERRSFRISRRRRQREQVRIGLLKDYFKDEIDKVDPAFYQRLQNSFFQKEDKPEEVRYKNILFNDEDYKDKDYNQQFPTIFHLRSELIHNAEAHDVRLVYLAILNIFKHRGHFLNEGLSASADKVSISTTYSQLQSLLVDTTDMSFPEAIDEAKVEEILCDTGLSRSKKAEELQRYFGISKKDNNGPAQIEIIRALCGLKVDAKKMFTEIQSEEKIDFCFADSGYDDKTADIESAVGEEHYSAIVYMKQIFDTCAWDTVIKGFDYLSDARKASYEKHARDLKILKTIIKKYKDDAEYNRFFRTEEDGTYGDYVGSNNSGKKTRRVGNKHSQEDFYASVKSELKGISDEKVDYILAEIEHGTFMPKQLTRANGVIPYQAHYKELKVILENASKYLDFLNKVDPECGLTVKEQILQIFSFRIPYFVGPVTTSSEKNKGNGWVVRKEDGPVRPWNIWEKIDKNQTSERFISRLVRRCTYISGENVLPKGSLLYERFAVLNEINSICIDGERIPVQLKQDIYNDLFTNGKAVTKNRLAKYLVGRDLITDENQISGMDVRINSTLSNYHKFAMIFGDEIKKDSCKSMIEDIVYWCTIFGDSKKFLKEKLKDEFGDKLTETQLKKIAGMKFTDWGKLSKAFLTLQGCEKSTGEIMSLSQALWNTSLNMMELLNSSEYTFRESLNEKMNKSLKPLNELRVEDLDEMYFSAPVKRMVWQTLLIIRELEHVLGNAPERVFVEMTRSDGEKNKRKDSRKQKFLDLYKAVKNDVNNWTNIINKAEEDGSIKSKKMYLYLLQKGMDLYTGKPISIDDLFNDNLYDIDHIYPQSLTKDDNLDNNMVLVNKPYNSSKQDVYPLSDEIVKNCSALWKQLHDQGFMNDEKYKRLTNRSPFTEDQLAGFIARQLVETSQATKAVAEILKNALPDSEIVYSKARIVSDFRNKYDLLKSRLVNDLHHANDAYLNIVVGNSYYVKFTNNPYNFIRNDYAKDKEKYRYNLAKFFEKDVRRGDEVAWIGSGKSEHGEKANEQGTIVTVKKVMSKHSPLLTRMSFEGHGGISDQTLYGKDKAQGVGYLPLKGKDARFTVEKYGGFAKAKAAYFFLVESDVKKERVRTIETVPIYLAGKIKDNTNALMAYCTNELGLINPQICVSKINIQSLVKRNGYYLHLTGKTGKQMTLRNATNLYLSQKWTNYIKKIENYSQKMALDREITKELNLELYFELVEKHSKGIFKNRPNSMGPKLENDYEKFKSLDETQQVSVLVQLLNLTGIVSAGKADLTLIGESKSTGVMLIPKKISGSSEFKLINQSVTGIYENIIDLLTV